MTVGKISVTIVFSVLVLVGTLNQVFAQESTVNVVEGKLVTLIGEGFDEDNDVLTFQWEQISGEPVELSATDVPEPQFMAPIVENRQTKELVFQLTVSDPFQGKDTSTVRIIVNPVNNAPYVSAGYDKVIFPTLSAVTLIGSAYDADHDKLNFSWKQVGGQPIQLISPFSKHLTVTPAQIDFSTTEPLVFELTVNDGFGASASDTVNLFPLLYEGQRNPLLNIDAGPIQEVGEGTTVTLHGSGQSVFGTPVTFSWAQNVGPPVDLSNKNSATPTFIAPMLPNDRSILLSFILSGYAPISGYASDIAIVKVVPVNFPPVANAGEDRTVYKNTKVKLFGSATDEDDDRVSLSWKQISGDSVQLGETLTGETSFVAPNVSFQQSATLTFQLTATDSHGASDTDDVKITVSALNRPPVVNAGPNRLVAENSEVTLAGSGFDPDGDAVSFSWKQISGGAVELSKVSDSDASFMAPDLLPGQKRLLIFELTGTDPFGQSGHDSITITVGPDNTLPTADAGKDQTVNENSKAMLSCKGTDLDGDELSFSWRQTAGVAIEVSTDGANLSFITPPVFKDTRLTFECSVSDGKGSASDSVNVMVRNISNMAIVADAGPDRIVNEKITVTIDGSGSHDPENQEIFFSWTQVSGEKVTLSGASSMTPSFTTPSVGNGEIKVLQFQLRVYDNSGRESFDTVMITVDPINAEPTASASARQD